MHRTWYRNGQLEEEKAYTEDGTWVSTRRWSEDGAVTYTDSPENGPRPLRPKVQPMARTNAEAHAFIEIHPCDVCGTRFVPPNTLIMAEGDLASRYQGPCPTCGVEREFVFRIPGADEMRLPPPDRVRYGDDNPSELIDAGEWVWLAEQIASRIPADPTVVAQEHREQYRHQLTGAVAALDEALKFIPPGADQVPLEALWTDRGRALYQERPSRFLRGALLAMRAAYHEVVDGYPSPERAPEPGPADQPLRVEDDEVDFDIELYCYVYRDQPFTGERYERWADGAVKAIDQFVDGRLNGLSRAWYSDGSSWSEGRFKINQPIGVHRRWYRNGLLEEEKTYTEDGTWVSTRRWNEDGAVTYTDSPESGPSSLRRS